MPDDAGVDRRFGRMERKARFLAAHEEHLFADAGADESTATSGWPAGCGPASAAAR